MSEPTRGAAAGARESEHRAGFVAMVGRPNAGKSTLTNALVGDKIAITSNRPQTTRHVVRGIVRRPDAEIVLVDTPGLHRPRTLLGQRLNDLVAESVADVDAIAVCLPATEEFGPGDRHVIRGLPENIPAIAVVTKTDAASRAQVIAKLVAVEQAHHFVDIIPVSAKTGEQVEELADLLATFMPVSPQLYPEDTVTDEPVETRIAELVREAALENVRDELPHSIAVLVEEIVDSPHEHGSETTAETAAPTMPDLGKPVIRAEIYVERDTQKAIVIGKAGTGLKKISTRATREIEAMLGYKITLDLYVRVAKDWQGDPKLLGRLGF